jgi:hypothetical protein
MPLQTRLITEVGTRAWLRVYWGKDCQNRWGTNKPGYHDAQVFLIDSDKIGDWSLGGKEEDYPRDRWPTKCDHCEMLAPEDAKLQVFRKRRYDNPEGIPQPGDMFWTTWHGHTDVRTGESGDGCYWHDNCDGRHLQVILPNGNEWDIDGRASNCTKPDDKSHRCWVREGEPPNITAGKQGNTCSAGGGSIKSGDYHGFLRNGVLT